ncbi:MAG: methyltransferase domain-containing protein [Candidatus Lokiarchaeota archaeon]|nr:methyltransferase domain-containing protein [Candidatus Lokiarchaeota archaeon]
MIAIKNIKTDDLLNKYQLEITSEIWLNRKYYFDQKSETWDKEVFHDPEKIKMIIDELKLKPGNRVLDVASGTGILIPYIFNRVSTKGEIIINDISEKMISIAKQKYSKENYPNLKFMAQDVIELEMNAQFDAIICYSCFPHFPNKIKLIEHLSRGLTIGGKLIIAHSESREKINKHHKKQKNTIISHDMLPPMKKIKIMLGQQDLNIRKYVDTNEMFYILAIKNN